MRSPLLAALAAAVALLAVPATAPATVLEGFDVQFHSAPPGGAPPDSFGPPELQAGAHPYAMTTSFALQTTEVPGGFVLPAEALKDSSFPQVPGFAGTQAMPRCQTAEFLASVDVTIPDEGVLLRPACAESTVVGVAESEVGAGGADAPVASPVYNLAPPPGVAARLGFRFTEVPVTVDVGLSESPPYRLVATTTNIPQALEVNAFELTLWGVPADPRHDALRGHCLRVIGGPDGLSCPAGAPEIPFLTSPRACRGPLATEWSASSWQRPAHFDEGEVLTHDEDGAPQGFTGCGKLGFAPEIAAQPTARAASSPTGLDFSLDTEDTGLTNANEGAVADSDIEKAVVTLPEGMSVNPSQAEGLAVCSEAQYEAETPFSAPGEGPTYTPPGAGCPAASKIGTVEIETPLLPDKLLKGSLYVAKPYENEFNSLLALYIVIKDPELGIVVRQAARIEPDPVTGQLTTVTEDMPQLPFSHFRLHFREGTRSPLVTPPACGSYDVSAKLYPYSGGAPITSTSAFELISGPDNTPCPSAGLPPFHPQLGAGTVNNAAGRFSPFNVKLTRTDSEQEFTHFSIKLPPGVAGKLAGIPFCTDAQIAAATARTGPHGGQEELDSPSCPVASQVGHSLAGSGVGPSLAYAPGKVYLAGPYHGHPLSLVAITAGVVGPFDIGTVVVRLAIDVNPETGEVFLDSTGSDPIPHIIKGIPIHLRDIRAYTDRPEFTFNPTSCEETSTSATVLGSGLDFVSEADDNPFVSTSRFQAADCAALPFKPKLSFKLKGGTKRGKNPSLRAHVAMNGFGEAAIRYAKVTLPKSEFLEQGHIGTICTRVQFNAGAVPGEQCPAASIYGKVVAKTPILSEPLSGPIFLRSSEHKLPDLVAALHGSLIDISLVGKIDSGKNGGIRNTFEFVPDAPVSSADFTFFGGKKSLLSNSRNLCRSTNKVKVFLKAHSGKRVTYGTPLKPLGCKKHRKKPKHSRHARHR